MLGCNLKKCDKRDAYESSEDTIEWKGDEWSGDGDPTASPVWKGDEWGSASPTKNPTNDPTMDPTKEPSRKPTRKVSCYCLISYIYFVNHFVIHFHYLDISPFILSLLAPFFSHSPPEILPESQRKIPQRIPQRIPRRNRRIVQQRIPREIRPGVLRKILRKIRRVLLRYPPPNGVVTIGPTLLPHPPQKNGTEMPTKT